MTDALKAAAPLAAVWILAACGGPEARPAASAEQRREAPARPQEAASMEWKGQYSGVNAPGARVIKTLEDWALTWADIGATAPAAPDFKSWFGAAVFLGQRNTGGYGILWLDPRTAAGVLKLGYRETTPTGMTLQVITQPYAVKLFPRGGAVDATVTPAAP